MSSSGSCAHKFQRANSKCTRAPRHNSHALRRRDETDSLLWHESRVDMEVAAGTTKSVILHMLVNIIVLYVGLI